jgi:hypothetical protein
MEMLQWMRIRGGRNCAFALFPLALVALALTAVSCGDGDSDSKPAHATVRRYEGATDPEEISRLVREGFLPIISGIEGFDTYYLTDAEGGVIVSTSVFRDQAGADRSTADAADFVRENLAPSLPNPPQVTAGSVTAHG